MNLLRLVPSILVCVMGNLIVGTRMPRCVLSLLFFVSAPPALHVDRPFRFVFGRTDAMSLFD